MSLHLDNNYFNYHNFNFHQNGNVEFQLSPLTSLSSYTPPSTSTSPPHFISPFTQLLNERRSFRVFLHDPALERQFRQSLRYKNGDLLIYLSHKDVLKDMIDCLINEDDLEGNFQDASESLNVLTTPDIEEIMDAVVVDHLLHLFSYLDKEKHQPRRVYFFLRFCSFLFQNRNIEMFNFVNQNPDVVKKLVHHMKSPHILQLLLNMLSVERQIKDYIPNSNWSQNCGLISKVVEALETNPQENFEAIHKFFSEVCLSYPSDSEFVKNIILVQDSALIKSVIGLMQHKSTVLDAIKLLDQVILTIMMDNKDHAVFFEGAKEQLMLRTSTFEELFQSQSLIMLLAGAKLFQVLVKHKLTDLLQGGIVTCLDLMFKFKWSNVLHTVVTDIICNVFKMPDVPLAEQLMEKGKILEKIVETFNGNNEKVGYEGHLRIIANAIRDCQDSQVKERLSNDEGWIQFLSKLDQLNQQQISFKEAEIRKRDKNQQGLVNLTSYYLISGDTSTFTNVID